MMAILCGVLPQPTIAYIQFETKYSGVSTWKLEEVEARLLLGRCFCSLPILFAYLISTVDEELLTTAKFFTPFQVLS